MYAIRSYYVGTSYIMPVSKDGNTIGKMGTDIIVIGTDETGSFPVKLNYRRQWEKYPLSSFQFELMVETSPNWVFDEKPAF